MVQHTNNKSTTCIQHVNMGLAQAHPNYKIVLNRGRSNLGKNCFAILITSHAMIFYYSNSQHNFVNCAPIASTSSSISLALGGGIVLPI